MKTCDDVLDQAPDALPWIRGEALEILDHLKVCLDCADAVEALGHTYDALRAHAPPAPALSADFADRVLDALPASPGEAAPERRGGPQPPSPLWTWGLRAAAAGICFAVGLLSAEVQPPAPGVRRTARAPEAEPEPRPQPPTVVPVAVPVAPAEPRPEVDDPLSSYVEEATLVLQAVETLDGSDPQALRWLAFHVQQTDLLDQGDRILVALRQRGQGEQGRLGPLISGTQLILRKVRHANPDSAPQTLWTLRQEVRQTGILAAYRQLLAQAQATSPHGPL